MLNRLIIIGNGFDLAHGLKTKYSDYLEDYWKNYTSESIFIKMLINISPEKLRSLKCLEDFLILLKEIVNPIEKSGHFYKRKLEFNTSENILEITNDFFHWINNISSDANWVDIEREYFKYLKQLLRKEFKFNESISVDAIQQLDSLEKDQLKLVSKLNKEIAELSNDFEEYLVKNVKPFIENTKNSEMEKIFSNTFGMEFPKFYREFPKKEFHEIRTTIDQKDEFGKTLVLNFNYTTTASLYCSTPNFEIINIHGQIEDSKNPINIGFGDENDEFYSRIENANQNEYLRYMKSFIYSNNANYKNLFDFIDSSIFQTYILGHSCGLSDRTLLNTIFEHQNCKSIKVFYHKWKSSGVEQDNYLEIVKNISRHFNKKAMMREKIVNKEYCDELPQNS